MTRPALPDGEPLAVVAVILVALAVSAGAAAFASPATADRGVERSSCVAGPGDASLSGERAASGHPSRASYPDAPTLDVARGDILAIPVDVKRGQSADVTVVGESLNVTVRYVNWDDDATAVLYVNTYLSGNETAVDDLAYTASGIDRAAVVRRSVAGGDPLATGQYDVTVERPSTTANLTANVTGPAVGDLDVLRAPGERRDALANESGLNAALASGIVTTPASADGPVRPAYGDTVVYRLNASGLFGLMAAQRGQTPEANFLALEGESAGDLFDFSVRADPPCPASVAVDASAAAGSLHVVPDATNETLYVLADHRRVETTGGDTDRFRGSGNATYEFAAETHLTASSVRRTATYELGPRRVTFDPPDGATRRQAAPDQSLSGQSTLAPGTTLDLVVGALDGTFQRRVQATVAADGTFETTVDLSRAPTSGRLAVSAADTDGYPGLVVTGTATAAAVWFDAQVRPAPVANVSGVRAVLDDGGFVAAYAVPPDERVGPAQLIGHSDYVQAGVSDVTVSFDPPLTDSRQVVLVAHRDTDDDGTFDYPAADDPYRQDGPVYAVGRVLVANDSQTPAASTSRYLRVTLPPAGTDDTASVTVTPTRTPTPTAPPLSTTTLPLPTTLGPGRGTAPGTPTRTASAGPRSPEPTPTPSGPTTDGATAAEGPGVGVTGALLALLLAVLALSTRRE